MILLLRNLVTKLVKGFGYPLKSKNTNKGRRDGILMHDQVLIAQKGRQANVSKGPGSGGVEVET